MYGDRRQFEVIAVTSANQADPAIAIAATRAGYLGVLDLEYADAEAEATLGAVERFAGSCDGQWGVKIHGADRRLIERISDGALSQLRTVVITPTEAVGFCLQIETLRAKGPPGMRILLEVVSREEAALGEAARVDGLIVKGHESGGRVGEKTCFILLQQLARETGLPLFAQGGIGLHTAAASFVAGAAGIVLDHQLSLTRESPLPEAMKVAIARMDGSETACLGEELGTGYRLFAHPSRREFGALSEIANGLARDAGSADPTGPWQAAVRAAVDPYAPESSVWLLGQDAALAAPLAEKSKTVCGVIDAIVRAAASHVESAKAHRAFAPDSPLAQSHGTRFPIVQGPMTRVSDRPEFAAAVAREGALPFLALALMEAPDVASLMEETRQSAGGLPWGVGILGFVPADLRERQLEVVLSCKPDFALIAGGRPDQSHTLEAAGIPTYFHVPSPGLLRLFLEAGARRFVFEGRECGGHVGPRSSFVLWNQMIEVLLDGVSPDAAAEYHVLFAGGIHDALSSAMVAAIAAPLADLGCKTGVLVGTAYTATREAVESGAIVPAFQQEIIGCDRTVLLDSGPGHTTRCADTRFVAAFNEEKRRLIGAGEESEGVRDALERFNVGRLRIASKGITRNPASRENADAPRFVELDQDRQRAEGLYMIGQAAALRGAVSTMAELHADIAEAGMARLDATPLPAAAGVIVAIPPAPAEVAVVGMGCVLPKAPDVATFWENILDKVDAISEIPADRWDWRRYYDPDPEARDKIYSKWGGFIDKIEFDPLRYGIPPNSLQSVEPLHLLTLEVVRAALIDAGFEDGIIPDPELRRRTSVILGVGGGAGPLGQRYAVRASLPALTETPPAEILERLPEWTEDSFPGVLMNVTAGRVANRFDLGGVNFTVDAACGSSLAAMRLAVQELEAGTSDMVIVGGADAFQNPFDFVAFSKTHALSPRGKCRTFDATADGIAISEGVAVVVLRRVRDAEREGGRMYARIRGVGGSSDGRDKSLTAPRPEGQALALRRAYDMADVSPASVGLIEAHGTGTVAGDRAEVTTLKSVFGPAGADDQSCGIGSVKSMIGHTKCAAGTAGLIKAALALYHKVLPPTLNVEQPNPDANFAESPFYIPGDAAPWMAPLDREPRRAGVSAFGFGGTNFHVILEENDPARVASDGGAVRRHLPSELFLWGASSREDLVREIEALVGGPAPSTAALGDLAYTLWSRYPADARVRLAIVANSADDLVERARAFLASVKNETPDNGDRGAAVRTIDPRGVYFSAAPLPQAERVAFLFPGQGSQYPGMLRDLAVTFPEVRDTFGAADAALAERFPNRLSRFVYPPTAYGEDEERAQRAALTRTDVAQPAIGAAGVAMARLLGSFGLKADTAAGHSYGEYVALHYGGVFDEATLFSLSEARGRCIIEAAGDDLGTMASVAADAESVAQHLGAVPDAQIANRNAPDQTVIAGPRPAVEKATEVLTEAGLSVRPIPVSCGFHSSCVAPARDRFAEILAEAEFRPPALAVFSNSTASAYPDAVTDIRTLLSDHLVNPVRFDEEIGAMYEAGVRVFVEVGPNGVLTGLVGRILQRRPHLAVASDVPGRPGLLQLQHLLAQLAVYGLPVSLDRLFAGRGLRDAALEAERAGTADKPRRPPIWLVDAANVRAPQTQDKDKAQSAAAPVPAQPAAAPGIAPVPKAPPAAAASNGEGTRQAGNGRMTSSKDTGTSVVAAGSGTPNGEGNTGTVAAGPPANAGQVMINYQRLMDRFLQAQEHVMLAYLQNGGPRRASSEVGSSAGLAAPAETVLVDPAPPARTLPSHSAPSVAPADSDPPVAPSAGEPAPVAPSNGELPPEDAPAPAPPAAALDRTSIAESLIAMICDRTGYPADMLGLELNLEADLGIDSIKRVEILGTFRKEHIGEATEEVRAFMEELTRKKTIGEVVDGFAGFLAAHANGAGANGQDTGAAPTAGTPSRRESNGPSPVGAAIAPRPVEAQMPRFVMAPVPARATAPALHPDPGATYVITDDEQGVASSLAARLEAGGARAVVVRMGAKTGGGDGVVDLTDEAEVAEFRRRLLADGRRIGGLFHCLALKPAKPFDELDLAAWRDEIGLGVKSLFNLAAALDADLRGQASASVVAATRLGGTFATDAPGGAALRPAQGGVPGLLKTLDKEWDAVRCKSVDFDETASPEDIAERMLIEAGQAKDDVEVGYRGDERFVFRARRRHLPGDGPAAVEIDDSSVILVTGGARGITSEITLELAERYRPTLILCGSSEPPAAEEAPETAGITDPRALKLALIEQAKSRGEAVTPAAVEAALRRTLRDREIRASLAALARSAKAVAYHRVDVRDEAAFGPFIDSIYETHGRLDGVVHGAGIIEDKLIGDKTADSFDRVVETKTLGAFILSRKVRPEGLKFLAFFTSVAGRFGNRGQSDYGAANEILSKLAVLLDRRWPGRVVAISWGPWDRTGMVSPEIKSQFAALGIEAIPPELGRWACDAEIRYGAKPDAEVVWGHGPWAADDDAQAEQAFHVTAPSAGFAAERPIGSAEPPLSTAAAIGQPAR